MPYEVRLTIYIILAIVVFGILAFWIIYIQARKKMFSSHYKKLYYKYVNNIVKYNDYYLINNLSFDIGDSQTLTIDHLVGGDKYIYVIIDYYIPGGIQIKPLDPVSYVYEKNDVKLEIANPLQVVAHSINKLSMISGISSDFLVGIVFINGDANVISVENSSFNVNIVKLRDLASFVGGYENRPVKPFVKKQLWQAIQDLHSIKENVQSRRNKKRESD